jgi:hypothetical protein
MDNIEEKDPIELPPISLLVSDDNEVFVNFADVIVLLEKFSETGDIGGAVKLLKEYHRDIEERDVCGSGSCTECDGCEDDFPEEEDGVEEKKSLN